jgi:hypothetical protein
VAFFPQFLGPGLDFRTQLLVLALANAFTPVLRL